MARAALECMALQVTDVFLAMQQSAGVMLSSLRADGGPTRNQKLMQLQADLLGVPVFRSENEELSAIGAAHLAGLAIGWWTSFDEIAALPHAAESIQPSSTGMAQARELYRGWQATVQRALAEEAA
jgi:glycerol kinase